MLRLSKSVILRIKKAIQNEKNPTHIWAFSL